MNETRRKRLVVIWVAFAAVMVYWTIADGFTVGVRDGIGLITALFGLALAYVYYANPKGMLDFGG